jgi:hypothetical protein
MSLDLYQQRVVLEDYKKDNLTLLKKALSDKHMIMTMIRKRERILHVLLDVDQCR